MNIEKSLKQILDNQIELKDDIKDIKNNIKRVKLVKDQTADLTEFITQTKQNFTDVKETLKFLLHKQIQNEREIFRLKQVKANS